MTKSQINKITKVFNPSYNEVTEMYEFCLNVEFKLTNEFFKKADYDKVIALIKKIVATGIKEEFNKIK